jgi:hypothetical protein
MKKSMIIAIIVVYILSIIAVNFFGLEIKQFEGLTKVDSIECSIEVMRDDDTEVNKTENLSNTGRDYYTFNFIQGVYTTEDESINTNPNVVLLDVRYFPANADNQMVKFSYDKEKAEKICVFDEAKHTLIFLKSGAITVTVTTTDGSNKSQILIIHAK